MKIEHLAIWVNDIERMKDFYQTYFGGVANEKYRNEKKQFESYFLTFDSGARLELMYRPDIEDLDSSKEYIGIAHLAISVGSKAQVDSLTDKLQSAGYSIAGLPRWTGDGYYESVILDPEGNRIEITI